MAKYNLQTMFDIVKRYFAKEYGYTGTEIELSNRYQNSINSYIYNDRINPAFVRIDELFESTVMGFLLAMFKWSKDFENLETYGECFKYVLFLMNDVCIFGEMQGMDANQALMDTVNGDIQIFQLAEDCYWTIVVFSLANEIAHAYLAAIGKKYTTSERTLKHILKFTKEGGCLIGTFKTAVSNEHLKVYYDTQPLQRMIMGRAKPATLDACLKASSCGVFSPLSYRIVG